MRTECEILKQSKNIAVVGLSDKPNRESYSIAKYLYSRGYNVAGVNPTLKKDNVDGINVYPGLKDVPFQIDIVDVFRRSELVQELIPDLLEVKPKTVWLQSGIRNEETEQKMNEAGIEYIDDTCIYVSHLNCR